MESPTTSDGPTGCLHIEENKYIHTDHPVQNSSPNLLKLSIKPDTRNLVEDKVGKSLKIIGLVEEFLERKHQQCTE